MSASGITRRTFAGGAAFLALAAAARAQGFAGLEEKADGFARVVPGRAFSFPSDHGPHPEFRIEWWYVTANLRDAAGTAYGAQWTLFRQALRPDPLPEGWATQQVWMAHAAVTRADTHRTVETFARGGVGQAGVEAAPFRAFIDAWHERHPNIPPVAFEDRKSFYIRQDYAPELRGLAEAIYTAPGFIRNLPPVPGALEAVKELLALGMDVRICSSPLSQFENCVAEKYLWVEKHLGRDATNRLILTKDKTLVHGHLLIDDKPAIEGAVKPRWKHILFDAPYNREVADRPRITWKNWRNVLAGELYTADE